MEAQMRTFILTTLSALGAFFLLGSLPASAGGKTCPDGRVVGAHQACLAANRVARQQPYEGPVSGRRADACFRILTDRRTEILMFAGDFSGGRTITGTPIETMRPSAGHYAARAGIYVVEFCFSRSLVMNLSAVTICNGRTPGEGYRHIVKGRWLHHVKRTGHVGDYLTLLGESSYRQYGHIFTARDYRRRYGG